MNFPEAINDAMKIAMSIDKKVICYGLGVDDPKRIFGTTKILKERFGSERVFDVPTSENALVGIGTGLALGGYKPVFVSQRFDFILLAIDQIVNAAAKWFYMFGSKNNIPFVIRLIVGRGWGQGPTHSQSLHSWFSHIPGLKVVMPSNPYDAKGLLIQSISKMNLDEALDELRYSGVDAEGVVNSGDEGDYGNEGRLFFNEYLQRIGPDEDKETEKFKDGIYAVLMSL